ncbi:ATP-binding protein [Chitinophagaceae bacterium LB-8]|uniref:Sensory/regulatory protein RpfC n=1 Tax=Paraflavisolibacter caeni TaxID=2982496 RepID=A0A9X3BGV3_9BACT|nr:ATP-binding protein [Paraflavisolibacter caeni]MCU7548437.1 ATP-binding protein [Paraflavisolibacter caeni]
MRKTSTEAYVMLDAQFNIVRANQTFVDTFPVLPGRDVRIGEYLPGLVDNHLKEMLESNLQTVLKGEQLEIEQIRHTDTGDITLCVTHFPIIEGDKVTGILVTVRDITKNKLAEKNQEALLKRYNLATSAIKLGIYDLDVVANVGHWDHNLYQIFELDPETPVNMELWQSFIHPACKEAVIEKVQNSIKNKDSELELDLRIITAKGNQKYLLNKMLFLPDEKGEITRIIGANWDVTEKEKAKEELLNSERKMRALLQSTREGFYLYDPDLNLILINEQGEKFAEMRSGKVPRIGQHVTEFTRPDEIESVIGILKKVLAGNAHDIERHVQANGRSIWLHLTYNPVREDDRIIGVCLVARDVTDLVHTREEMTAARTRAEQSEQLQEQFLANMSHEIRTPLNGIVGMSNLLLNTPLNEEQQEFLKTILHSSDTLLFLINDILDLSKIKAGKFKIEKIPMNIFQVVEEASAPFRAKAQEKGIRFSVMMDPFIPKTLSGDPHRLMQVLNNLLSNAIKFTNEGTVKLEVEVVDKDDDTAWLDIAVSDTGIGIDDEKLQFVFESFAQEGSDTARRFGGTGLGLAITKRLAELQGGTISVHSTKGQGSRFIVRVPYDIMKDTKSEVQTIVAPKKENLDFRGKRVMVVEDNQINQQVFSHLLKDYGIQVTIAGNGKQAIEILEAGASYDLILLDLRMPEMDGFQTLAYMRQKLKLETPIIVLTASVLRDERQRCLDLGATDYLSKPIPRPILQQRLSQLFSTPSSVDAASSTPALAPSSQAVNEPQAEVNTSVREQGREIDMKTLLSLTDKKVINDVYNNYIQVVPAALEEMKKNTLQQNWDLVSEQAHKLKSSLNVINIKSLTALINEVEEKVNKHQKPQDILPALENGIKIYQEALPEITRKVTAALA